MKFSNLPVRLKLGVTFAALTVFVVAVAGVALASLRDADARFERFIAGINTRTAVAAQLRTAVDVRAISARNLVLVTEPSDVATEKAQVTRAHADVQKHLGTLKGLVAQGMDVSDRARSLVAHIDEIEQQYAPVALAILKKVEAGDQAGAIADMNAKCRPLLAALTKASDEYAEFSAATSQRLIEQWHAQYESDRNWLVGVSLLAVAVAIAAAIALSRAITGPIGRAVRVAEAVAAGDLTSRIEITSQDETGRLLAALQTMNGNLLALVGQVRNASDGIAIGSKEIATGNADLSQRTEEQASSLQQTAASMEQLSSTVRTNSDAARQASELAASASAVAAEGGERVQQVVRTMEGISQASHKIAAIIGVIDGIAFQTNILALNAAVEAARAGEQGRGFAVVAGEVRTLAQRSAEAAREIKALIQDSAQKVEAGSGEVNEAGRTISDVVAQVQRVNQLIAGISTATGEQTRGIGQVADTVVQLDQVTQQNAALVEQSAAAAESLNQQAQKLVQAVGMFRVANVV
jgi:methyl-accepting chemotaxis protein